MNRVRLLLPALLALLVAGAASAATINSDRDPKADLSALKTFHVKLGTPWGNDLGERRVMDAVAQRLKARGLTQADEAAADALVVVHGATAEKQQLTTFYDGWNDYHWGYWGSSGATTTTYVTDYTEGTLVVDVFEAKTKQVVYRATATGTLAEKLEKRHKKVEKALDRMFEAYPTLAAP